MQVIQHFRVVDIQRIKAAPVAAAAPGLAVYLQQPIGVVMVDGGLFLADERGQPQPGQKAAFVRGIGQRAQPVREFGRVRFQPVADFWLPAVVDLEKVAGLKQGLAAVQIFQNRRFINILVPIVPAGISGQLFCGARAAIQGGKPRVKNFVLAALGKKEIERGKCAAIVVYPGAIPLNAQGCRLGIVVKNRIAGHFVQACHQAVMIALTEIAVGEAVACSFLLAVSHKMIVAVAVKGIFVQQKSGDVVGAALAVPLSQFRAFCPRLVAVHKQALVVGHRPGQRCNGVLQRTRRQIRRQMHTPLSDQRGTIRTACACGRVPMQFCHVIPPCFLRAVER